MTSGNQWDRMGSSRSSCWANCIITHLLETLRWDDKQQSQSLDQLLENGKYPKQHSKINQLCLKYEISVSPLCKLEVEVLNVKEIMTATIRYYPLYSRGFRQSLHFVDASKPRISRTQPTWPWPRQTRMCDWVSFSICTSTEELTRAVLLNLISMCFSVFVTQKEYVIYNCKSLHLQVENAVRLCLAVSYLVSMCRML